MHDAAISNGRLIRLFISLSGQLVCSGPPLFGAVSISGKLAIHPRMCSVYIHTQCSVF